MGLMFGYQDLKSCKWLGDDRIEEFIVYWDYTLENMEDQNLTELFKRDTIYEHMTASTLLKEGLAHYDRQEAGHPDRATLEAGSCARRAGIGRQGLPPPAHPRRRPRRLGRLGLHG